MAIYATLTTKNTNSYTGIKTHSCQLLITIGSLWVCLEIQPAIIFYNLCFLSILSRRVCRQDSFSKSKDSLSPKQRRHIASNLLLVQNLSAGTAVLRAHGNRPWRKRMGIPEKKQHRSLHRKSHCIFQTARAALMFSPPSQWLCFISKINPFQLKFTWMLRCTGPQLRIQPSARTWPV